MTAEWYKRHKMRLPGETDSYSLMVIIQKIFDCWMQQVTSQNQAFQRTMKWRNMVYENCYFEASKSVELIIQLKETVITFLHTPPQIIFLLSRPYNCSCTADSHYSPDMVKVQDSRISGPYSTGLLLLERLRLWPLNSALSGDLCPTMTLMFCKQNFFGGPQTFPFINSIKACRP